MPKMKTHRGAAKRFTRTATGKIKRNKACISHLLGKKSSSRKRRLRREAFAAPADVKRIERLIPT